MRTCEIWVKNTRVMTDYETISEGMDLAISDGKILAVQESGKEVWQCREVLDGRDKIFMPGLIDSHMHTGQQLLKGLVLDAKPIIWTRIMLPFESTMTAEKMRLSAELAAVEMIKSGTTAFVESGSYEMNAAAEIYEKSGLRGCLSYSTMDETGLPESIAMDAKEAVSRTDQLYEAWNGRGNLKVFYSLRALNSCSGDLIESAAVHANERHTILQAHMNEYQAEVDGICEKTSMRPYEYLEKLGVLSEQFLGAHSLLLSESEKELIQKRKVKICHCPFSNCGKAVPETPGLLERGIIPGFGTDGAAHGGLSLWNEMRIFRSLMNIYYGVPEKKPNIMPAETLFRMMYEGGAKAIGEMGNCGLIREGAKADLISVGLGEAHMSPSGNLLHTLFECGEGGDVKDMIVGGKLLMKDRELFTLDEEKILWKANEYRKKAGEMR